MMKVRRNTSDMNMAHEGRNQFILWWSLVTVERCRHFLPKRMAEGLKNRV